MSPTTSQRSAVIDTGTNAVVANVPVGAYPQGVAVDPTGAHVYVANYGGDSVSVIDTATNTVTATIPVSGTPTGDAVGVNGNVYVAGYDNSPITEISMESANFNNQAVGSGSAAKALGFTVASGTTVGSIKILTAGTANLDFADGGGSTCTAQTYSSATNCVVNVKFTPAFAGLRTGAVVFYDGSGNELTSVPLDGTGTAPQVAFTPGTASVVSTGSTITNYPFQLALDGAGNLYVGNYVENPR